MPYFDKGHALVIGVGKYQDASWNAAVTIGDATEIAATLTNPQIGAYPPQQVNLLVDGKTDPTLAAVTKAFEDLAAATKPSDTAFIFYCGHGVLGDDGDYYLTTSNSAFTKRNTVEPGTGLSSTRLRELLAQLQPQKLLLIVNSCFSGRVNGVLGPGPTVTRHLGGPLSDTLAAQLLASGDGRAIMTASRSSQYSNYIDGSGNTYFGKALIESLHGQGMAVGGDFIGLFELYQAVYAQVTAATAGSTTAQEPVLNLRDGVGPFPIALFPGAGTSGRALGAPQIQTTPPQGTAYKSVPKNVVNAVVAIVDVNITGNLVISGDSAGGNITKITTTASATDAAAVTDSKELLALIDKLKADVDKLPDKPDEVVEGRDAAGDALTRAKGYGEQGKMSLLRKKLEEAQAKILAISGSIQGAADLATAIGATLQRAMSLPDTN